MPLGGWWLDTKGGGRRVIKIALSPRRSIMSSSLKDIGGEDKLLAIYELVSRSDFSKWRLTFSKSIMLTAKRRMRGSYINCKRIKYNV